MPIGNSQYGISRRQENIPTKCETIPQLTRTQNSAVRHEQYTQKFMANPEPIQLLFLPQSNPSQPWQTILKWAVILNLETMTSCPLKYMGHQMYQSKKTFVLASPINWLIKFVTSTGTLQRPVGLSGRLISRKL